MFQSTINIFLKKNFKMELKIRVVTNNLKLNIKLIG